MADTPIDMNKLSEIETTLNNALQRRNTIRLLEFMQYVPLFMTDGMATIGEKRYAALSKNWAVRVSIYEPVYIVTNDEKNPTLLLTLPPIVGHADTFNVIGKQSSDVINFFFNAMSRDNSLNTDNERATDIMVKCINYVNTPENIQKRQQDAEAIEKEVFVKLGKESPDSLSLDNWF